MSSDWTRPFEPDEHTVALYHFDEGEGDQAHDACGDPELTLRAYRKALWGSRPGFGSTARFDRQNAHLLVGPANNDKLELRTCTREWTVEAWVRYTGPGGKDRARSWPPGKGYTCGFICATDEEGCALADGYRQGWSFHLHQTKSEGLKWTREDGLIPEPDSLDRSAEETRTMTQATPSCPRPRSAGCTRTGDASATRSGITWRGSSATAIRRTSSSSTEGSSGERNSRRRDALRPGSLRPMPSAATSRFRWAASSGRSIGTAGSPETSA